MTKHIITAVFFFYLIPFHVVFASETSPETIQGTIFSHTTRLPLDSVRISLLHEKVITWTSRNGHYSFLRQPSDTTDNQSALYKTMNVSSPKKKRFHLLDIKGRLIGEFNGIAQNTIKLPHLPFGLYYISTAKGNYRRILNIDQKITIPPYRTFNLSPVTEQPFYDTLFIYKPGYLSTRIPIAAGTSSKTIYLKEKRWLSSDIHNHTVLTDGDNTLDEVLAHAFSEYDLDVLINSEHGGSFTQDTANHTFSDLSIVDSEFPQFRKQSSLPRWYTLSRFSWPKIIGQRKRFPEKILLQGLEWNCPGHYHASVGFVDDAVQPEAISEFEYRFDQSDNDLSHPEWHKHHRTHQDACTALKWLEDHYPASSYFFVNHPSREPGTYTIASIRDFIAAAPAVCLGFEAIPGHQKKDMRGGYTGGTDTTFYTHGGADIFLSHIGGVWDALLSEGHHFRAIVNSDFHRVVNDFWPGEYHKTWSTSSGTGAQAWLDGIRNGEIFIVNGDLISDLDFNLDDGLQIAVMGEDFRSLDTNIILTIRFRGPGKTAYGNPIHVDHIDLIAGSITGKVPTSDPVAYNSTANADSYLHTRFSDKQWKTINGWNVVQCTLTVIKPTYFRLRGTNLAVGTPGELTMSGEPLQDHAGLNTPAKAWHDLWFYSNPIFVYPGQ